MSRTRLASSRGLAGCRGEPAGTLVTSINSPLPYPFDSSDPHPAVVEAYTLRPGMLVDDLLKLKNLCVLATALTIVDLMSMKHELWDLVQRVNTPDAGTNGAKAQQLYQQVLEARTAADRDRIEKQRQLRIKSLNGLGLAFIAEEALKLATDSPTA